MKLVSVKQFSVLCNCTYEAIRQRIENKTIIPVTTDPTTIDADKYPDTIQLIKLRASNLQKSK